MNGWIKIHKSIMAHWLWDDPFTLKAWMDILLNANYADKKTMFDGNLITVNTGQIITSIRKLSERWGCSKEKVSKILDMFAADGMLIVDKNNKRTLLTVVNYRVYQNTCDTESDTESDTDKDTDSPQHKNNKEIKENKNNIYMDFIIDVLTYLNQKTGKNYTGKSKAQKQHMVARIKEGFTVDDFKRVIDNKVRDWGNNPKMKVYLRPETLFGTKFETYLNDNEDAGQKKIREQEEINARQRANYDDETAHFFG